MKASKPVLLAAALAGLTGTVAMTAGCSHDESCEKCSCKANASCKAKASCKANASCSAKTSATPSRSDVIVTPDNPPLRRGIFYAPETRRLRKPHRFPARSRLGDRR